MSVPVFAGMFVHCHDAECSYTVMMRNVRALS